MLIDPHTLVLDEATSVMDARAARSVERALGAVLAGRTVVSIAHRLHTAHDADRIAVVEHGRIVELGTTAEVVGAPKHPYTRMLLAAAPVPDPLLQRERRAAFRVQRRAYLDADSETGVVRSTSGSRA